MANDHERPPRREPNRDGGADASAPTGDKSGRFAVPGWWRAGTVEKPRSNSLV
jgi:hypothetical protein